MNTLDEMAARTDAATPGPWRALGTGSAGGDHWYICDDREAIASISCQDGINEEQRQPDAEFIAHARDDVPKLVKAIRLIEQYCTIAETDINGHQREPLMIHPNVIRGAIREALG
ncbi:hypothetical protein [Arthrobacter sp. GMC3]|uniref:hypothetical protein n=1 Tax=Arthrobacter sp. GMC3 TaxID=2058894 RepID=UPI000CE3FD4C|nr:hypothetical protein [Arthrobacter sp. GMC3]